MFDSRRVNILSLNKEEYFWSFVEIKVDKNDIPTNMAFDVKPFCKRCAFLTYNKIARKMVCLKILS